MNHGQFYKADQLVETVHKNAGGMFAGFRGAHAFGRIYKGTFRPTALAKTISRAAHFQTTPVPVTARLSAVSGDPSQKPENVVAMATKFYLPDGTITDLIGITLPSFFAGTPEEFFGFEAARAADPATGKPDMAKLMAYLANHPNAARVVQTLQSQQAPASLAQTSFRALHAYRFVNAADESRWARYHWEPEAGVAGQSVEELLKKPHDYLFDEFEARLQQNTVEFRLDLRHGWHRSLAGRPNHCSSPWSLPPVGSRTHRRVAAAITSSGQRLPIPLRAVRRLYPDQTASRIYTIQTQHERKELLT